jgi:hypothetical protein
MMIDLGNELSFEILTVHKYHGYLEIQFVNGDSEYFTFVDKQLRIGEDISPYIKETIGKLQQCIDLLRAQLPTEKPNDKFDL